MSDARLTALRLVGFKSFAERTTVEFGPGISAIVGPNGSGKSNLADALRWTLGEQGRSLRTRRSEDLIFAGSSSRRAIGMADVTLIIDNHDRLLPVDYGEVEIGRRLYRSGENEYLLNRQKIRLRDLVELLDASNLADNAFLFIGQGMVDQALALRPEERRPLFEEAAGVRRHERRRRQAESELVEAESNLERLRDVLAELRPQARRLAAQAEQLQARQTAGVELAEALLAAARARWLELAASSRQAQTETDRARAAADAALAELKSAEEESAALSAQIGRRADAERAQRDVLDGHRRRLTELRVEHARLESEHAALERDAQRVASEHESAEARRTEAARILSQPATSADARLDSELELIERQLAEFNIPRGKDGHAELAARRAEHAGEVRRREDIERALADKQPRLARLVEQLAAAQAERDAAVAALAAATRAEGDAAAALAAARTEWQAQGAARSAAAERVAALDAEAAALRVRVAALDESLRASADDGLARAARARGGRLLGEGLEIEPRFRAAVSAALGAALTAFAVGAEDVGALATRRGTLAIPVPARRGTATAAVMALVDAARAAGGGVLAESIRRDPQGVVTRLLERVLWLPDLESALRLIGQLGPGWRAITLSGEVIGDEGIIQLAGGESILDRRAERDEQAGALAQIELPLAEARRVLDDAERSSAAAAEASGAAQKRHDLLRGELRRSEESERAAQRRAEQVVREHDWEQSQAERLGAEEAAARSLVDHLAEEVRRLETEAGGGSVDRDVSRQREQELRERQAELRRRLTSQQADARSLQEGRRRAEVTLAMDEARRRDLDAESVRLAAREVELGSRRTDLETAIAAERQGEAVAAAALQEELSAGADDRSRLVAAERRAARSREVLRDAESRTRVAEVRSLEARLSLEQTREQLLVELAGIGRDGTTSLLRAAGAGPDERGEESLEPAAMEEMLGRVIQAWQAGADAPTAPGPGRVSALRRRFHELGAGNPFAAEEYDELRARLESLDAQRADMESAIGVTRDLIASLSTLINEQFRATFAALEDAFARRFTELFGGGDAQLSLTVPDDLSSTGVEIHARPPGKKRQPLSMLSGGERALTAVSLLLAMLEVRPVPFCVLDEVDAALDEANIGRFTKALRGLAEQTQFIVITHNRGTIEGADALYGVTIGDDAVSRVISLRLPQPAGNGRSVPEALVS